MGIASGKSVTRIVEGQSVVEGDGFTIQRLIPTPELDQLDPFVLLDHAGPKHFEAGAGPNIPAHPHAGFEIVTYIVHGGLRHRDSAGMEVEAGPGDLMWMTAGAGLIHEELAGSELLSKGGNLEVIQLWINLPAQHKQAKPNAGVVRGSEVPTVSNPSARVLSGSLGGTHSKLGLIADLNYFLVSLAIGERFEFAPPEGHSAFALALSPGVMVGVEPRPLPNGQVAVFSEPGDLVTIGAHLLPTEPHEGEVKVIFASAAPTGEPVVRHGPFVMNSVEGIRSAIQDYQSGKMGSLQ